MGRLWYKTFAGYDWNKGLPIGNGKLGAMILGDHTQTRLALNEDSLWYGGPVNRVNPDAYENLDTVRELILSGKISEAEHLMLGAFSGVPTSCRTYAPLGNLTIRYDGRNGVCETYLRELSVDRAVYSCHRDFGDIVLNEDAFADAGSNTIVVRIASENAVPFDVSADFDRMSFYDGGFHDGRIIYAMGRMVGDDYSFCAGMTAYAEGGETSILGRHIFCKGVTEVCILFTAATTFREKDPVAYVRSTLNYAESPYRKLLDLHEENYRKQFASTVFNLPEDPELSELPTDERLARIAEGKPDNGLLKLYFDFGRYLLISCSQPGSLPANLQGIWNPHLDPPWGSKYTININLQMNYWPVDLLGLSECSEPLFELIKRVCDNGSRTAREMYGCRGSVAHHNTDLWGDSAPQDEWIPGTYWVMGLAWLCTHVWSHYRYTGDTEFLRSMYPVVKESVAFFHDFCIEHDGYTTIVPSVSPENTYILPSGERGCACYNSTMDIGILRDLFTQYLSMSEIAGEDDQDFIDRTKELLAKLPPISIGQYGQIMEWQEDYEEAEPGHRHISHLYGLYPSGQITVDGTPELAKAARVTLERRLSHGGGHTGWSRAWIMNMFARLWDADACYENLTALLARSTLSNLLDNHPPFQIDGNFGAIAAYGEMLLQSNDERVVLLPALPKQWPDGSITGLHALGGARYTLVWKNGKLVRFTVTAGNADYRTRVVYRDKSVDVSIGRGEEFTHAFPE